MLAMSPLFPTLGWEYSNMELGTHQSINMDDWNLDSLVLPNFATSQAQANHDYNIQDQGVVTMNRSESPRSVSSRDHSCGTVIAKKLNHNASERDRRKKINYLYSTLRSMLPANDHTKKLSIPATVGRVLKYIPELQKEMDDLIHKKDDLLSKFSQLQGDTSEFIQEEKPRLKVKDASKSKRSCSISTSKLGDREIMIQISSLDNILLPELILKLETGGLQVLDVSSFRTFGGSTFYNIHLWKKLSIPSTVGRVLKYIPELQKEVDDLMHKKDELLSKFSILQGASASSNEFTQEQKPKLKLKDASNNKHSSSISTSKLGDKEIMIQISSLDNILLPELILKLETDGLQLLDVSSFRTFGGSTFYNLHLWNDGVNIVNCDKLNEELPSFIQNQNMNHIYH
ncbi:transcription factor ORG3-like [Silene latifolia]|uniref:transcription factor ORG3-like n=1 Tax=Silene latifolia TaxID=37657 RepID=UPI003D77253D